MSCYCLQHGGGAAAVTYWPMPLVAPPGVQGGQAAAPGGASPPPLHTSLDAPNMALIYNLARSLRQGSADVARLGGLQAVETANELLDFVVSQLRCARLDTHPAQEVVDLVDFHDHIRRNTIALAQEDHAAAIVSRGLAELADALAGRTRVSKRWNDLRDVTRKEWKRKREEEAVKARAKGLTGGRTGPSKPGGQRGASDAPSDPRFAALKSALAKDTDVRSRAAPNGCWACISLGKTLLQAQQHRMTACPVWRDAATAKGL